MFWSILGLTMSGFMAANTIFVWPKLLSAMFILIAYLCLVEEHNLTFKRTHRPIIGGFAGALAMLCHGGAIFALLPLYVIICIPRIKNIIRIAIPSGLVMLVVYFPWILYQRLLDPPGDRLIKWHLAGHPAITDRPFLEVLTSSYSALSSDQWLANKAANIGIIVDRAGQIVNWLPEIFHVPFHQVYLNFLHDITFGNFFFSFWFFSPLYALIIFAFGSIYNSKPYPEIRSILHVGLLGLVLWVFLMFLPKSTSIHQGTYFLWLCFYVVASGLLLRTHRGLLVIAAILNSLLFIQFYILDYVYLAKNGYSIYLWFVTGSFFLYIIVLWLSIKSRYRFLTATH